MIASNHKQGFTLIEIMVAVSIFAIVATIAISALLAANAVNQKAQAIKLAMDNLAYAMDSMTFRLKQGTQFRSVGDDLVVDWPKDNPTKTYTYSWVVVDGWGHIEVDRGDGSDPVTITSPAIDIDNLHFSVYNGQGGGRRVWIRLSGVAHSAQQSSPFALETVVSER